MCSKKVDDVCVAHFIYPNLLVLDFDLLTCMSNICDVHGKYLCQRF